MSTVLALAGGVPNPTFARPDAVSSGTPAGWVKSGAQLTAAAVYDDSPDRGHARVQKYTLGGTGSQSGTVTSKPLPPGRFATATASYITGFLLTYATGLSATSTVKLTAVWYNSAGTQVDTSDLLTLNSDDSTWTAHQSTVLKTPASAHHVRLVLTIARTVGNTPIVLKIAFCDIGTYTTAAGYYTVTKTLCVGTQPVLRGVRSVTSDAAGNRRRVDRDRFATGHQFTLFWELVDDTERKVFDYLFRMNTGRVFDVSAATPNGGSWPLIVVPDLVGMPLLFEADCIDEEFGDGLAQTWWSATPTWRVTLRLAEIV